MSGLILIVEHQIGSIKPQPNPRQTAAREADNKFRHETSTPAKNTLADAWEFHRQQKKQLGLSID